MARTLCALVRGVRQVACVAREYFTRGEEEATRGEEL